MGLKNYLLVLLAVALPKLAFAGVCASGTLLTTFNPFTGKPDYVCVGGGGSGGSSSLAIGTGTASNFTTLVTSPTAVISFLGGQFQSTASGTTNFINLDPRNISLSSATILIFNVSTMTVLNSASFLNVSSTVYTQVSTMTFGNGTALVMSTSTNFVTPSGQLLNNASSVTVQGVIAAGSNITLTPTAGFLTIASIGSGIYAATATAVFPFGFSASTGEFSGNISGSSETLTGRLLLPSKNSGIPTLIVNGNAGTGIGFTPQNTVEISVNAVTPATFTAIGNFLSSTTFPSLISNSITGNTGVFSSTLTSAYRISVATFSIGPNQVPSLYMNSNPNIGINYTSANSIQFWEQSGGSNYTPLVITPLEIDISTNLIMTGFIQGNTWNTGTGALKVTGPYYSNEATVTFASQVSTVNWNNGNVQYLVLTGTTTIALTNPNSGGRYLLMLAQDGTGSRTVTWPASAHWSGGTTPVLTVTPNKIDAFSFIYEGNTAVYISDITLNH